MLAAGNVTGGVLGAAVVAAGVVANGVLGAGVLAAGVVDPACCPGCCRNTDKRTPYMHARLAS